MVFCSKQITIMNESFFSSIAHSCLTFCDPMDCSTLGFPVHHHLPELAQTQCSLSRSCHPIISSYVVPFSSCPQSFPATWPFQMSQLFASGGQSIGVSASTSVLPMNTQDWFLLGWTGWISLQSRDSQESSPAPQFKSISSSVLSFLIVQLSHPYMTTGKTMAFTTGTFIDKVMSLLFNMLSRLVITFLPRSKRLLISWLQSPSAVILKPPKIKSATVFAVSHLFALKWWDQMPWS